MVQICINLQALPAGVANLSTEPRKGAGVTEVGTSDMTVNGHMRDSDEQSVATFTEEQVNGDDYTREEDPDPRGQSGKGSYWNFVDEE